MPEKTLLITLDFAPRWGGIARYLVNVCAQMPVDQIMVLAPKGANTTSFDDTVEYKITRKNLINNLSYPKWLFSFWFSYKAIKDNQIKQIWVGNVLPLGTVVWLLSYLMPIKYTVITHGMDVMLAQEKPRRKWLLKKILKRADTITANSNYTKQQVVALGINSDKIVIVYPGLDLASQTKEVKVPAGKIQALKIEHNLNDKKIILSLGRLVARKGVDKMLEALPQILKKQPEARFVILGDGPYRDNLEKIITELNLKEYVVMRSNVSEQEKLTWLATCDVFTMPARQISSYDVEGFGIVYLEANYFGKPVVGGNSAGVSEAIINNETGLLCDPYDPVDIAAKITQILADPVLAQR